MLTQSILLIVFILLGVFLQRKMGNAAELRGVKLIILNIALPATIFVALMSVSLDPRYLLLPVAALGINLILFLLTYVSAPVFGVERNSRDHRTLMMLLPSLAPGLSCFPFLTEYLGDEALAFGALADVGNKIFVLLICYMIAIYWFQRISRTDSPVGSRLKSLILTMLNEPINLVIITALVLVALGFSYDSLPVVIQETMSKSAMIMTPLVLMFIGMSVKLSWADFRRMTSILFWRSGTAFLISGIVLWLIPGMSTTMIMLILVFPQSATSFWPFAHMTAIDGMDEKRTFNTSLAISLLACSLPFSTFMIMGVFSLGDLFTQPWVAMCAGGVLVMASVAPMVFRYFTSPESSEERKYQYAD